MTVIEIDISPDTVDSLRAERDSLRRERDKLLDIVKAADLVHIRLRAGLREALDGWLRVTNRGIPPELEQESITKIAELRALLSNATHAPDCKAAQSERALKAGYMTIDYACTCGVQP